MSSDHCGVGVHQHAMQGGRGSQGSAVHLQGEGRQCSEGVGHVSGPLRSLVGVSSRQCSSGAQVWRVNAQVHITVSCVNIGTFVLGKGTVLQIDLSVGPFRLLYNTAERKTFVRKQKSS